MMDFIDITGIINITETILIKDTTHITYVKDKTVVCELWRKRTTMVLWTDILWEFRLPMNFFPM
jgi:hypothetical protein